MIRRAIDVRTALRASVRHAPRGLALWDKVDERHRNEIAIGEHLTYIDALLGRSPPEIERACRAHLTSAKETLLRSTSRQ